MGQIRDALPTCLVERVYSYGSGGAASDQSKPMLAYLNQPPAGKR